MKKSSIIAIGSVIILLVLAIALFWHRTTRTISTTMRPTGTTSIQLSGTAGAAFTGYYVRDGKRVAVSGVLPWSVERAGVTEFEFRKVQPDEEFTFAAHYDEVGGAHAKASSQLAAGAIGIRGHIQDHGLSITSFRQ